MNKKNSPWDSKYYSLMDWWITPSSFVERFEWKCEYCGKMNLRQDKCEGCYAPYNKQ